MKQIKFISIYIIISLGCTRTLVKYPSLENYRELNIGFVLDNKIDPSFEIKLIQTDSNKYISYLNSEGNIVFFDFARKQNFKLPFKDLVPMTGVYMGAFVGDSIVYYHRDSNYLYVFNVDYNNFQVVNSSVYNLKSLWENGFLMDRYQTKSTLLVTLGRRLYIGYQSLNPKTAYLGSHAYLKSDLTKSDREYKKVCHYPEVFRDGKYYDFNTHLLDLDDSSIIYAFNSSDSIYKVSKFTDEYIQKGKMTGFGGFKQFNSKKIRDLGYVREYSVTSEINVNIFRTDDRKYLVVIKHLPKKNLNDKDEWGYCILTSDLIQVYKGTFNFEISPFFCFPYEKGFIALDKNFAKTFYYEIP